VDHSCPTISNGYYPSAPTKIVWSRHCREKVAVGLMEFGAKRTIAVVVIC